MRDCCSTRRASSLGLVAVPALAALVPKCPMCVAVYLTAFGVSASWAPWLRPVALVAGVLALVALGVAVAARRWRSAPCVRSHR